MMKLFEFIAASTLALGLSGAAANAATFSGEFWDATSAVGDLAAAEAIVAGGAATATFMSTAIDYPNGVVGSLDDATTLTAFLGVDAPSLSGSGLSTLDQSVFRFTGFLDLVAGDQLFRVGSDDGFRLTIGGTVISSAPNRPFTYTDVLVDAGSGRTAFELLYWENQGFTGVEFKIDGALATASAVPLPAGLPLILVGLGALGIAGRKRRAAA